MELVPAGVALSFEVTFDRPFLDVAMSVYDDSGADPVLILGPFAMDQVVGNTYRGKFTPEDGKSYIITKAVYTDPTYTLLDSNYFQGSESIYAQTFSSNTSSAEPDRVVGYVEDPGAVIGSIEDHGAIIGAIQT